MTAPPAVARILIVANRTSSTPILLEEVTRRAHGGARITLLIPPEQSGHGTDWTLEDALELLERAAGEPVGHMEPGSDAFDAIHRAVDDGAFDEIIVSTPPAHLSRLIHHDLRHRLEHLEVPVRVIPPEPDAPLPDHLRAQMPESWSYPPPTPGIAGTY